MSSLYLLTTIFFFLILEQMRLFLVILNHCEFVKLLWLWFIYLDIIMHVHFFFFPNFLELLSPKAIKMVQHPDHQGQVVVQLQTLLLQLVVRRLLLQQVRMKIKQM